MMTGRLSVWSRISFSASIPSITGILISINTASGLCESGALKLVENIIRRDYDVFSGSMLERYFRDKFMQSGLYTDIGMYWNRKGENEIDLITLNDLDKTAAIYEIKRDESRYSITKLEEKVTSLLEAEKELKKYSLDLGKLSLRDM